MKIFSLFIYTFTICLVSHSQSAVEPGLLEEQQLEDLADNNEAENEDEYLFQQFYHYRDEPLNLNGTTSELAEFPWLNEMLIQNLVRYRELLGDLVSIYELQAVPGFTLETIQKILPYVFVQPQASRVESVKERFHLGSSQALLRSSAIPERARGFRKDSSYTQQFTGDRMRTFFRYRYQFRDLLQYGITGDKDAGESWQIARGKPGFDFYSFHLFLRRAGLIKALALGDFTINMGQGLVHWQSQAFKKSAGTIQVKRQSETLRPYHSAGEYNFHRGVACTVTKHFWEASLFISARNLSANKDLDDNGRTVISSIQQSGLHRTSGELADKSVLKLMTTGGVLKWERKTLRFAFNAIRYHFSIPLQKKEEPYNVFAVKGQEWSNYSADYTYTYRNTHFFAEAAVDKKGNPAFVSGAMTSLDSRLDFSILYRNIGPYQSLYGNAFTEGGLPSQEKGLYLGLSFRPASHLSADLYADVFQFGWLKYRIDAPAGGKQYLVQLSWKPVKTVELYTRFRFRANPLNIIGPEDRLPYPESRLQKNWRTHISFRVHTNWVLRSRIEACWFDHQEEQGVQTGSLFYADLVYKPVGKWYSGSFRYQIFETDGYDTRLYAYENDVLFASSTPAFFDSGSRIYLNVKGKWRSRALRWEGEFGVRMASTLYSDKTVIGSGPDEINSRHRSEIKFQAFLTPIPVYKKGPTRRK